MIELKFRHWYKGEQIDRIFIDMVGNLYPATLESKGNFVDYDYSIDCSNIITERFTGIKDKNKEDIYEGDILYDGKFYYTVEWNAQNTGFWLFPKVEDFFDNINFGNTLGNGTYSRKDLEITSNIHKSQNK